VFSSGVPLIAGSDSFHSPASLPHSCPSELLPPVYDWSGDGAGRL